MDVRVVKLLRQLSGSEPLRLLFGRTSHVITPPSQVTPNHVHTGALVFQLARAVHASPPNALYTHISDSDGEPDSCIVADTMWRVSLPLSLPKA